MTDIIPIVIGVFIGLLCGQAGMIIDLLKSINSELHDLKQNYILEAEYDDDDGESWKRT